MRTGGAAAARRSRALRERVIARHRAEFVRRTDRYFAGFYRRTAPEIAAVAAEVTPTKADDSLESTIYAQLGRIAWDQEARILSTSVEPVILSTMRSAYELASDEVGAAVSFDLNARPVQRVLGGVGTRIRLVEDVSRKRTASMVAEGIEKGLSVEQIVRGVPPGTTNVRGPVPEFAGIRGMVDSWTSTGLPGFAGGGTGRSSRSYLIALTETGNAYNLASLSAYAEAGVDFVEVFDGQDCGWASHNDPDMAHGSIRSVEDAAKRPLSHPRCQRAIAAREDVEEARPSPYAASRARGGSVPGATPGIGAVDPLDAKALKDSGYEKVARPTPAVAEAAQRQWERARVAEPGISKALQAVTDGRMVTYEEAFDQAPAAVGGDLAGFAARRKSLTSLSRKIAGDMAESADEGFPLDEVTAAGKIGDTVRYTVRFSPDAYGAGARQIAEELEAAGNRLWQPLDRNGRPIPKWKAQWSDDVNPNYRGTNTNWIAPNGTVFEVQFHTPESFYIKENVNHALYEEWRLPTTPVARQQELAKMMQANIAAIEVPPGIPTIAEILEIEARVVSGGTFRALGTVAGEIAEYESSILPPGGKIGYEQGGFFEPDSGRMLTRNPGTGSNLAELPWLEEELALLRFGAGPEMGFTHTHPSGSSFSIQDVEVATLYRLRVMRAIGSEYAHDIRPGPSGWSTREALIAAYQRADDELGKLDRERELEWSATVLRPLLAPLHAARVDFMDLTDPRVIAYREITDAHHAESLARIRTRQHRIWERLSAELGLVYTRTAR